MKNLSTLPRYDTAACSLPTCMKLHLPLFGVEGRGNAEIWGITYFIKSTNISSP
jgi:hypothetical protein